MVQRLIPLFCLPLFLVAACERTTDTVETEAMPDAQVIPTDPADMFIASLRTMCGNAYRGELVEFNEGDLDMVGEELVMHVRECADDVIHIPFHVGEDRSRTWIFTRTEEGLRLKHDHRHADGSDDEVTMYGGDTVVEGTGTQQAFHADNHTAEMIPYAANNIWTVEVIPGELFSYYLRRTGERLEFRAEGDAAAPDAGIPEAMHGDDRMFRLTMDGRRFRVAFDLTQTVDAPPAPWGYEETNP